MLCPETGYFVLLGNTYILFVVLLNPINWIKVYRVEIMDMGKI